MKLAISVMAVGAVVLCGCATVEAPTQVADLGARYNPVKADMPPGQREYLSGLRCADGKAPAFNRQGSVGMAHDGHVVDAYAVTCASGKSVVIHMDMYHAGYQESRPVEGFTLVSGD